MKKHEITLKNNTFKILNYDAAFYSFIGDREIRNFDSMLAPSYADKFYANYHRFINDCEEAKEKGYEENDFLLIKNKFFLILLDEYGLENGYFCWFTRSDVEDACCLVLISADELISENQDFERRLAVSLKVMEIYKDSFFNYDPMTDVFNFYYIGNTPRIIFQCHLEEYRENLLQCDPDLKEEINLFIDNLRAGAVEQRLLLNCDINNPEDKKCTTIIQSGAIYKDGDHYLSTGFIHVVRYKKYDRYEVTTLDPLTKIRDKNVILREIYDIVDVRKEKGVSLALCDIDGLDKVKASQKDEVIKNVASIIDKVVGNDGRVGYLGEGTFLMYFFDAPDMEFLRGNLESVRKAVNSANRHKKTKISLSMGLAAYPKDALTLMDLMTLCEFGLNKAHEKGGDAYVIYSDKKHPKLSELKEKFEPRFIPDQD